MTPYLVSSFQMATLSALIRECFGYDFADIFLKDQVTYLFNYLQERHCVSMLLEPEYIDREFLEDYSRYYVKRFDNDSYECGRIHFFSHGIDHKHLDLLLQGEPKDGLTPEKLQEHYLGFMVVKPLSRTFVGKTCLQLTGDKGVGDGTKKKIAKRYDVNLFGIKLHVDSIAFQEQDKVVAACATTAIWTALHALPWRDVKHVPSCSEITINALNFVEGSNNGFPNKELTTKQIQRSLDVEGLRYHSTLLLEQTLKWFQACVTSYIDSDLPLVLVGEVYKVVAPTPTAPQTDEQAEPQAQAGTQDAEETKPHVQGPTDEAPLMLKRMGNHAVTVLGYDFRIGSHLLYVHDDRLGPYARVDLIDLTTYETLNELPKRRTGWALAFRRTPDLGKTWLDAHEILIPDACIVPAEKKARLPFQYAHGTAEAIAEQIGFWTEPLLASDESRLEPGPVRYNIKLSSIAEVREHVRNHKLAYSGGETLQVEVDETVSFTATDLERWKEDRIRILTSPMARLQWEIDFFWGNKEIFKVLLDATDIPLGNAVSGVYASDPLYSELVFGLLRDAEPSGAETDTTHFYGSFRKALELRELDYVSHLNQAYGALRAPLRLEPSEVDESGKGLNETLEHYFDPQETTLQKVFPQIVADPIMKNLIWAIGRDGSLFVAVDIPEPKQGHPSMTGLQAARIAGEIWWTEENGKFFWHVNHASGRYSRDYATPEEYLKNAVRKIASFFQDKVDFVAKGLSRPPLVEERLKREEQERARLQEA
ncbi:hypothetical protein RYA95_13810 [Pseudomonas syringae pv. actinidiae]|uniref:hypothetical protein n=1 Tax=Pseudomonas syringae TaxID=317 RepID=UPI0003495710|nr:hypothetical protein [Pseudomonas syringae]AYL80370.1 hypothetical protein CN228_10760 [Pseudomonas syringae pv. actinidiae str. Shaanxi_M228]MDU8614185.1 hypothetical protein [Pseudomonas syringae pv. actinidiae]OSN82459.1 hypothetical protein BV352_03124 [Pseudomonas syringae pv. actinidiae]